MIIIGAVLESEEIPQAVIQCWLYDMIDADWIFTFGGMYMFYHATERVGILDRDAIILCRKFWRTGDIPTPYNITALIAQERNSR